MKRKILFLIIFINCVFSCFAIPVVEKKYDSDYHKYYCSELFETSDNLISVLDDCKYYVIAYDPGTSVRFIIQFREKRDAMNLIQQYKNITSILAQTESQIRLDYCSEKICNLIRCYVKQYKTDMDYIFMGEVYSYAVPLQQYETLEEYETSQKKAVKEKEKQTSNQYRPCSLF